MKYAIRKLIRIPHRTLIVLFTVLLLLMWSVLVSALCASAIDSKLGALDGAVRVTDGNKIGDFVNICRADTSGTVHLIPLEENMQCRAANVDGTSLTVVKVIDGDEIVMAKRKISVLLILATLISTVVACGGDTPPTDETTLGENTSDTAAGITVPPITDDLGEFDFEGYKFKMYIRGDDAFIPDMWAESTNGDVLNWNEDLPYINLDKPYWNQDARKNLSTM